jgi:hypothetical protein
MKLAKENFWAYRLPYFAAAALFLFFLLYSAPHQVHHAFDPEHSAPCLAFSVAKSCHLQLTAAVDISIAETPAEWIVPFVEVWVPSFTHSPYSQRAPPTV